MDAGCADLEAAYDKAVLSAKLCNPNSLIEPCTELRPASVTCGCPTFINAGSGAPIDALQAAFSDAGCLPTVCPRCIQVDAGVCTAIPGGSPDEGECVDL